MDGAVQVGGKEVSVVAGACHLQGQDSLVRGVVLCHGKILKRPLFELA